MNTDDHILATFLADNQPLDAVAAKLGMTLIALVRWLDHNADLLAAATRAMETRLKFLSLRAEIIAIDDLSAVSRATRDEERKRKSASQLLRHVAKRLFPPPPRKAPPGTPSTPDASNSPAPMTSTTPIRGATSPTPITPSPHAPARSSHSRPTKLPLAARLAANRLAAIGAPHAPAS